MKNISYTEIEISNQLRSYISFLKAEKFNEIVRDIIDLSYEYKLPAFKQLERVRPEAVYNFTSIHLSDFFNGIVEGNSIERLLRTFDEWAKKQIGKENISLTDNDITTEYTIRKQVLIKAISDYSGDPLVYINLVQEIGNLITHLITAALRAFSLTI